MSVRERAGMRGQAGLMLLGGMLALAGCDRPAPEPEVRNEVDLTPPAPVEEPPAPEKEEPAPPPPPPVENKIEGAEAEQPLSEDEQMMQDAEAAGMTARIREEQAEAANEEAAEPADDQ